MNGQRLRLQISAIQSPGGIRPKTTLALLRLTTRGNAVHRRGRNQWGTAPPIYNQITNNTRRCSRKSLTSLYVQIWPTCICAHIHLHQASRH